MPLVFLTGGARSGKSRLALELVAARPDPVVFLATAEAREDEEMAERIARHRSERPQEWLTVEEPLQLLEAIAAVDSSSSLLVDCLSLWVSNALERMTADEVEAQAALAAREAAARTCLTVAVTNEVGMGLVPSTPLGRTYRDVLGRVNALWADAAESAYLVVAGRALALERLDG